MNRRLPPQPGEWIDRTQPISFRFEGELHQGYAGDVITSALYANDVRRVGRSFKYHRPRGSYSFANHDANALFTDGRRINLPGDATPIEPALDLYAVNTAGGLERDRLRVTEWFSAFMPVGFYYKAFHRPRWLFPFHERQMRKVAGLARINPEHRAAVSPKDYAWCDVLVVGAGPTGLSAAVAAADCGAQVTLVDENARLGGSLAWQFGQNRDIDVTRDLVTRVEAYQNITVRRRTVAAGYYADHWLALVDETRLTKLRARAVVFATGAFEQPAVFQNNDLPGVMMASGAQRLIRLYAVKPFDAAVVLAANTDGYRAALDLHDAGSEVRVIVDLRSAGESSQFDQRVRDAGIPVRRGSCLYEVRCTRDKSRVTGAIVCPLTDAGQPDASAGARIDCDGVAVSVGWTPNAGLLAQAGFRFGYADHVEQLVPVSTPPGVVAAGRVNGVFDLDARLADGQRAGLAAAHHLGMHADGIPVPPVHTGPSPSHRYPVFDHPGKKNFIDFDEDIHLTDLVNAHQEGYDNVELMKRYTTVGMGPSQGKLANFQAVRVLARCNAASINETGTTTSRPFHHPVSISHLAGRRFHPMRRTPMHDWHAAHDAELMHAGSWYRPEFYRRNGATAADRILAEAMHVRRALGLIDLSTLGKFFVRGPDALTLLERLYTGRFAKLAAGRQRYVVALDETGVVIEDGVIARLAEDVYYVSATSAGADRFYRDMQRWSLVWGLDVSLSNATGHYAAMNFAGPDSREALAAITDINLASDMFPFLAAREGRVADVHAIVLRVGFVGELGYEIHVPASQGMRVWSALLEAGRGFEIQPFGVEAQRLLRLEKGHLIVGQDTDALTHPHEAGLGWTLGKDKPFFVGQRSVRILSQRPLERTLVGIRWPEGYEAPLPEECHLIIEQGKIIGRVTSIAHRSTLGYPLGMAFVHPDLAAVGTELTIRVHGGFMSRATVARLPHYDPKNERQT